MAQQIILGVILILMTIMLISLWDQVYTLNKNIEWFGAAGDKAREKKKESFMTDEKMNAINDWLKTADMSTLTVDDKLEIEHAAVEHIERLEPLYDKYHSKNVRYR